MDLTLDIQCFEHGHDLPLPTHATAGSAGVDLYAAIASSIDLPSFERMLIPTGIAIAIPKGFEGQIRPRSGLALKHGLTVLNTPGTIDADYRGEIHVLLVNLSPVAFTLERGMRVAQLVIAPCHTIQWNKVHELQASLRKDDGFGSTGY